MSIPYILIHLQFKPSKTESQLQLVYKRTDDSWFARDCLDILTLNIFLFSSSDSYANYDDCVSYASQNHYCSLLISD